MPQTRVGPYFERTSLVVIGDGGVFVASWQAKGIEVVMAIVAAALEAQARA